MKPKLYTFLSFFILFHLFCFFAKGQAGSPNTAFGTKGVIRQRFFNNTNSFNEIATGIVHLSDGRSIISLTVNDRTILTRITSTGATDLTYGINGYSEYVRLTNSSIALGNDGSIYMAGYSGWGFGVAHFDVNGTVDKSFGINGVVTTFFEDKAAYVQTIIIQPNNKIVLAGHLYNGKNYDLALARYNLDGSLDAAFGKGGKAITDFGFGDYGYAATMQTDGKILVSGGITTANGFNNMATVRYTANGQLDIHFGNSGKVISQQNVSQAAHAIKLQPDGKIIVAGGNVNFILLRYNSDGSPDATFAKNGLIETDFGAITEVAVSLELQADGQIIVGGDVRNTFGITNTGITRISPKGVPDESFGKLGKTSVAFSSYISNIKALKLDQTGKIVAAGAVQQGSGKPKDYALFRCESNGTLDKNFGTGGQLTGFIDAENTEFRSIVVQGDHKIIAGGFSDGTNDPDFALARFNIDGSPDVSFGKNGKVINNFGQGDMVNALAILPDGKILAAGNVKVSPDNTDFIFARYNTNGTPDISYGVGGKIISAITPFSENLLSISIQADKKVLAGGSTLANGLQSFLLTRYNSDGSLDNSFAKEGKLITTFGYAQAFLVAVKTLQNGKILSLARALKANSSSTDIVLAQFNTDGTPDVSFGKEGILITDLGLTDAGQSLAVQADGKIIVGGYSDVKGINADYVLIRYQSNGVPDMSFGEGGKVFTDFGYQDIGESVSVQPDGKIIQIGHSIVGNEYNLTLARYQADGHLDSIFGEKGKVVTDLGGDAVFTKSIIVGNNIYASGSIRQLSSYAAIVSYSTISNTGSVQFGCPANVVTATDKNACSAVVSNIDPVITSDGALASINYTLSGAMTGTGTGTASGKGFGKGVTSVTYTLAGDPSKTCTFSVTVEDQQAPEITHCPFVPLLCYSTNGLYVIPKIEAKDNCGNISISFSISGTTNRIGKGNDASGAFNIGESTISWIVIDENGNSTACQTKIKINPPISITIPNASAMNKGVEPNTVYYGYKPASSLLLTAKVSGGTAPYNYSWSNGATTLSATVSPTATGLHTLTVTDAAGCKQSESKKIVVVDVRCGNNMDRVQVCHVPLGNPQNAKSNCIPANAVAILLANGSSLGACKTTNQATASAKGESIEMVAERLSVQVMPNPSSDYFSLNIQNSNQNPVQLTVLDQVGRVVEQRSVATSTIQIGHNYPGGVYFAEVLHGKDKKTIKLIKKKAD